MLVIIVVRENSYDISSTGVKIKPICVMDNIFQNNIPKRYRYCINIKDNDSIIFDATEKNADIIVELIKTKYEIINIITDILKS